MKISIHASAKEATKEPISSQKDIQISIHASAKEATKDLLERYGHVKNFNPRLREGGDLFWSLL